MSEKVYCEDCFYYQKSGGDPMFPVWTWIEACRYINNVIINNIGKSPTIISNKVLPNLLNSGNMIEVAAHFDKMYEYKKHPQEINKNRDCKWFDLMENKLLQCRIRKRHNIRYDKNIHSNKEYSNDKRKNIGIYK